MIQHDRSYKAYMLRIWLENDDHRLQADSVSPEWRASLEDPHTQNIQVFADLHALFDFLLNETSQQASDEDIQLQEADEGT